ncbi:hypothetical protein ACFQT0_22995 [Hymenobacter humi]|uniref:Uncharacterized protein n=1 Tax=Hymenobacter humi TaxID=1411620 RepID=A0ABW2U8S2_9BACT
MEVADEIKSAKDMGEAPSAVRETVPTEPVPTAAADAPTQKIDKLKVKSKSASGSEKIKQKGDEPEVATARDY